MTTQPDAPTDVERLDPKTAVPPPPSAAKRKADELEEKVARVEPGEEKRGGTETNRKAKRRKKNKKRGNGSKGDSKHKDKKETSGEVATGAEEPLGANIHAQGLEVEAIDSIKINDSDISALKPKKEKKNKKKDKKEKMKDQTREQSDHEMLDDQPNGKKHNVRNSPEGEDSKKDKKRKRAKSSEDTKEQEKKKKKSIPSPSSSPQPEKHPTTPLSTETATTPKSLLKKSNNKTPTPRTKTVTFADDVKSIDGDSIPNTIRFPGGIGGRSNIPRLPVSPQPHPALLEQQSSSSPNTTTAAAQQETLSHSPNLSGDYYNQQQNTKPQIAYLLNYYQARSSWKFSKTKQNWIIRNIWNLSEFSAEVLQSALWAYVNGLPAQGPKDRLLAEAKEVAKTRREELGAVDAEDDPKYRRAKLVLTALGDDDIPSEDEGGDADEMDEDNKENVCAEGGE